ncbi:IS3 family transposase [Neisseria musculi]|uniref:IS3 family transposase n=1 Tax=Neisseria musculi TaxID=1815583 RepID=UPI003EBF256C
MYRAARAWLLPSEKPILCSDRYGRGITKLNRANANRCKTCRARKLFGQCGRGKLLRHVKKSLRISKWNASAAELKAALHEYIHYYHHDRTKLKLKGLSPV